jgi:acyl-CoA synthetase (AMP-forming)/AMP-acid ligase II
MPNSPIYTLGALLRHSAQSHEGADALVFPDSRLSHAELDRRARRWASALVALGVEPGDHVGIFLPTCPEFVELMFGISMAGATAVPINARYQAGELAYLVENADLVALVTTADSATGLIGRVQEALPSLAKASGGGRLACPEAPKLKQVVVLNGGTEPGMVSAAQALADGEQLPAAEIDRRIDQVKPQDIALILYTSGTTSNPKGCLISHRGMVGNSRNLGKRYRLGADDRFWSPLPIFHIAGILPLVAVLDVGGAYLTIPFFEGGAALAMLDRERATCAYPCFVTIMQDLINHRSFPTTDLSRLRLMNANFAVQPDWIREAMSKAMPQAICVGTYGLTEGAGTICTSRLDDSYHQRVTRLGVPLDEWEVRIQDPESGAICSPDQPGEIVARGPNMLKGYYRDPTKTAETIDPDGWFHTGDLGFIDADGQMMFTGRVKDMMKVGGENVAAAEIEAVLNSHPAVKLSQVVGIPDPRYVEVPAAFVELKAGASANEAEIIAFCRGKIANFKLPRHVRFVTVWPMSTSKIQKFRLRDELCRELAE